MNQEPIGLFGGDNFYQFATNAQIWLDPLGLKKYSVYGLYRPGDSKLCYIGITDNIKTRAKQHRKSGRLVGTERLVELYSDLDYETARGYEEGCIRQHGTLTGKNLKRVRKVILILKKLKPEEINVIHLLRIRPVMLKDKKQWLREETIFSKMVVKIFK